MYQNSTAMRKWTKQTKKIVFGLIEFKPSYKRQEPITERRQKKRKTLKLEYSLKDS